MSKTQLFIPEKCKVGLQKRGDTYTGKLGYIIYHDGKVWRKEGSWESWRHKEGSPYATWNSESGVREEGIHDDSVKPIEFDNVPTEGFVLNKKAGGYSSGWNHRQTYSRVYDPRGWEFEITIPNLLYILQECSSYKGKGLEGEFVYSWDGKDLVLLPVSSPDYKMCKEFTDLQSVKFSARDLKEGYTYLTGRMQEWVYIGRYNVYEDTYNNVTKIEKDRNYVVTPQKKHVFVTHDTEEEGLRYEFVSSMNLIKKCISESPNPKFPDYVDTFLNSIYASLADHLVVEPFSEKWLKEHFERGLYYSTYVYRFGNIRTLEDFVNSRKNIKRTNAPFEEYEIYRDTNSVYSWHTRNNTTSEGTFSKEELMQNYGMLVRVYKNGFKKIV